MKRVDLPDHVREDSGQVGLEEALRAVDDNEPEGPEGEAGVLHLSGRAGLHFAAHRETEVVVFQQVNMIKKRIDNNFCIGATGNILII